jgi:membrane-associated phospholipid phosphatase
MQGLRQHLSALDRQLFDLVATTDSAVLDRVLPRLSLAANYGRLWMGIAAVLVLTGRPDARRAAIHGMTSLAVASATANVLAKGVFPRGRPHLAGVPVVRRLVRAPVTTSFPSGHSASAVAFATAASMEMPVLTVPLGVLALAVSVSRVATGAHYPSDVVAGMALGAAVAGLTRRCWPRRWA